MLPLFVFPVFSIELYSADMAHTHSNAASKNKAKEGSIFSEKNDAIHLQIQINR